MVYVVFAACAHLNVALVFEMRQVSELLDEQTDRTRDAVACLANGFKEVREPADPSYLETRHTLQALLAMWKPSAGPVPPGAAMKMQNEARKLQNRLGLPKGVDYTVRCHMYDHYYFARKFFKRIALKVHSLGADVRTKVQIDLPVFFEITFDICFARCTLRVMLPEVQLDVQLYCHVPWLFYTRIDISFRNTGV